MTDTRLTILDWLRNRGVACSIVAINRYTGYTEAHIKKALASYIKRGDIIEVQTEHGPRYKAVR